MSGGPRLPLPPAVVAVAGVVLLGTRSGRRAVRAGVVLGGAGWLARRWLRQPVWHDVPPPPPPA